MKSLIIRTLLVAVFASLISFGSSQETFAQQRDGDHKPKIYNPQTNRNKDRKPKKKRHHHRRWRHHHRRA